MYISTYSRPCCIGIGIYIYFSDILFEFCSSWFELCSLLRFVQITRLYFLLIRITWRPLILRTDKNPRNLALRCLRQKRSGGCWLRRQFEDGIEFPGHKLPIKNTLMSWCDAESFSSETSDPKSLLLVARKNEATLVRRKLRFVQLSTSVSWEQSKRRLHNAKISDATQWLFNFEEHFLRKQPCAFCLLICSVVKVSQFLLFLECMCSCTHSLYWKCIFLIQWGTTKTTQRFTQFRRSLTLLEHPWPKLIAIF